MASLLVAVSVVALVAAAVLQFTRQKRMGGWLLVVLPASLCVAGMTDVAHGARYLGEGAYVSDLKELAFALVLLLLTILAAFDRWARWLFWVAWVLNAAVCGALVYLAFFWKVFS